MSILEKTPLNSNAVKALEEMKMEIANEMGLSNNLSNLNPVENIFTAGPVGGMMTRKLVEMGQKQLIDK
ncbi:alpha/beta-type small acid-soluble spore protein [Tissierella sp. MB52-C2]|uniref:alpha/beta-type small acid-soluble spore protein n=1 Tax=Tissierella sp. MB52-C2 TaxID=3070999 RepID=UPI00280BF439|nr:alpha/beta-type small acid-soluble spore protein [Tissierella sp. MB52-C2]WMM24795.1 alpha/beta-type small acid-soluble spore protein [Tissierella sp. MB52-C2]